MNCKLMIRSALAAAALASALPAAAVVTLDLTAGGTGTANGTIFTTNDSQSTGTGVIQSFVRVSTNATLEQGYNTSARPLTYDENSSPTFTRDLSLSAVPIVTISGVQYREFLLDINQTAADPYLSLDKIQIYVQGSGGLSGAMNTSGTMTNATFTNLVWSLDTAVDRGLLLNYALNSGSGSGDLFMYVANSLFTGGTNVYLYSQFGATDPHGNNDGFEEWAVRSVQMLPVPEPGTYALMLAGLGAVGFMARRRRQV